MKQLLLYFSIFHLINLSAQTNSHLPLKSYSFDFVSVNVKESADSPYHETGQFHGVGEIQIYSDSITITWSNEWECGTYRLFVDTATYQKYEYGDRLEWLSFYSVRSKGYHQVDGLITLVDGNDLNEGSYLDIIFDTKFTEAGWARERRMYVDINVIR